jgi:hypothetical protein
VPQLISSYSAEGCNMSLKTYSAFPFEFFPENMEDLSDEHGERFLRIYPKLKRGTLENRVHLFWLTTTGVS